MARLAEVKAHAAQLFAAGRPLQALELYDAVVAAYSLDFEARLRVADCLVALEERDAAIEVYRAVAWYCLEAGHPLAALVAARVVESLRGTHEDLLAALVVRYGSESELVGKFAARINLPSPDAEVTPPHPSAPVTAADAAQRAARATADFSEFPAAVHPIPLLSELSEDAFRRVLSTLIVRRMGDGQPVIREGEPGQSFFFVATGEVRVFDTDGLGRERELARLRENALFGEMALLSAQPRSATVSVVGEADLLEVTSQSLSTIADELEQVATALHRFTRDRLLANVMARSPLFRPFSSVQRRDLLRRFTSHDVAPGTDIICEGDEGRGLFVVLSGEVEVETGGTPLATLRTGDVFGEMALLRGGPTSATVRAATPTTVLYLAREYVTRMVAGVPEIKAYLEALAGDRELETRLALGAAEDDDPDSIVILV